uniref:Uncharacterized protein n=1 Tax=Arundo donax TaxID=35708 RepID=A0A0A9D9Y8_ARUDO
MFICFLFCTFVTLYSTMRHKCAPNYRIHNHPSIIVQSKFERKYHSILPTQ